MPGIYLGNCCASKLLDTPVCCSQDGSSLQHVSQKSTQLVVEQAEPVPMAPVALPQSTAAHEWAKELAELSICCCHEERSI